MKLGTTLILLTLACSPQQVGCEPRDASPSEEEEGGGAIALPPVTPRQDGQVIEHTLRFPAPAQHFIDVETVFEAEGDAIEVMMAVWIPGSYLVREFARNVQNVRASALDGASLQVDKTRKNRWTIRAPGGLPSRVVLRYRLYAREVGVRTNFVDTEMAIINGSSTFLVPVDQLDRQHDIRLELPGEWSTSVTALDPHPDGEHRYLARDYDELVDSPIAAGNPAVQSFEVQGAEHVLATFGGGGIWDDERAGRDVQAIVEEEIAFWRVVPYRRYVFINLLLETGGGLEHSASTVIAGSRWNARDDDEYRSWLGLVSHEFFHTWNIKRLRPASLGPFDYENENYVRDLWVVEGITSYYDDLLQARSGLLDESQYLARVTRGVDRLLANPGRQVQSLSASSFDSWIHFYRPDANTRNSGVSYYTKGALVAWLLDARIRRATGGQRSLDDAMRLAYERFSEDHGYSPEEIRAVFTEVAGEPLDDFWRAYVDGVEELDFAPAFREFGLRFAAFDGEAEPWLGLSVDDSHGRLVVKEVVLDGPAFAAGINVDDELIAFGDERLPSDWTERLGRYDAGDEIDVLVSRRGALRRLDLRLGEKPRTAWTVEVDEDASPGAGRARAAWLD